MSAIAERAHLPDLFRPRPAPWHAPALEPQLVPEPPAHGCRLFDCELCGAEADCRPVTLWLCAWCVVGAYD